MDYRNTFYKNYFLTHTKNLYGKQQLEDFKKEFSVWGTYFSQFLPENKNIKILDLGCGSGGFVYWLKQKGFSSAEGIDISRGQVAMAKELDIKNIQEVNVFEFLRVKKNEYDIIFARDFLEHFKKDELLDLCNGVLEALRPDGLFLVQTVNAETLLGARLRYADVTHETAFTSSSVSQLMGVVGFVDIGVYPMRPVVHGIFSFARYVVWMIIEALLHVVLIAAAGYKKGIFTQDILCVAKKQF